MEFGDIGRHYRSRALLAEEWIDEEVDRTAVFSLGRRFAADADVLVEEAFAQLFDSADRLSFGVARGGGVIAHAANLAQQAHRLATGDFGRHRTELPEHDPPAAAVDAILDQEDRLPLGMTRIPKPGSSASKAMKSLSFTLRASTERLVSFSIGRLRLTPISACDVASPFRLRGSVVEAPGRKSPGSASQENVG